MFEKHCNHNGQSPAISMVSVTRNKKIASYLINADNGCLGDGLRIGKNGMETVLDKFFSSG
jgi:hypothetical protein